MKKLIFIFTFILLINSCKSQSILILGNSIFYDAPSYLYNMSLIDKQNIYIDSSLTGGYYLHDHIEDTSVVNKIKSRNWDYIIIVGIKNINPKVNGLFRLESMIDRKTKILLFQGYSSYIPTSFRKKDMLEIKERFDAIKCTSQQITIVPVGEALDFVLDLNSDIKLFQDDYIHPSKFTSILIAYFFYYEIFRNKININLVFDDVNIIEKTTIETTILKFYF